MISLALLVIDEQIGAFDGKLLPPIYMADQLLTQTMKLIEAARNANVPVIYIQHCADEGLLVKGTEAWPIHPMIAPKEGDHVIEKFSSSAFEGTNLGDALSHKEVQGIVVCGLQSEHCISNTTLDALSRGMNVYVCGDAHSTWSTEETLAAEIIAERNEDLAKNGALVAPASEIVSLLRS
jgi:nicotinamidase-related amidase